MDIIGITLGDVCGIGPEVVIKAINLLQDEHQSPLRILIIGDARVFKHFCAQWLDGWDILTIDSPSSARFEPNI
ncbi:MAG: 4-hydroxythreonine-4-phosphate dehydrogenase PdxA, partial [Candidatus Desantisbacteria bacterium]